MDLSCSDDVEWQMLLDAQLKEERRRPSLFERVKPVLFVLSVLALALFFLQTRSSHIMERRASAYVAANNPVGVSKAEFKSWVARKGYRVLRETEGQVTVAVWGKEIGINRYWSDDAVEIGANFDADSRLASFGPATKTTLKRGY